MRYVTHVVKGMTYTDSYDGAVSAVFETNEKDQRVLILRDSGGKLIAEFDVAKVIKVRATLEQTVDPQTELALSLRTYVTADDVKLSRREFLGMVADRIKADIGE